MSQYLADISTALQRVLDGANRLRSGDNRLMGYAANIGFWADELEHCLRALDGFADRQSKFDAAIKSAIRQERELQLRLADPLKLRYGEATTSDQLQSRANEAQKLRENLVVAGKTFFQKLHRAELIDQQTWFDLQDRFEFLKKT